MAETQTVDLGFRMRGWQRAAADAMVRFTVLVVHRRGGKTVLAVMKLIHEALITSALSSELRKASLTISFSYSPFSRTSRISKKKNWSISKDDYC